MSRSKSSEPAEGSAAATVTAPASLFEGVTFKTPLLKLVEQILGPHVRHAGDCTLEPCTCGAREAVLELQRREFTAIRYGAVD